MATKLDLVPFQHTLAAITSGRLPRLPTGLSYDISPWQSQPGLLDQFIAGGGVPAIVTSMPRTEDRSFGSELLSTGALLLGHMLSGGISTGLFTAKGLLEPAPTPTTHLLRPITSMTTGGAPMDEGFGSMFGDLFSGFDAGSFLPSSDTFSSVLDFATPLVSSFVNDTGMAAMAPRPLPPAPRVPMPMPRGGGLMPRWAGRFPNLYSWATSKGVPVGRAIGSLLTLLRKWGPTALTALVGVQVVSELITYSATHKRRRMNVANTKALRRSLRRLKGFHHLSHRVSMQLSRSGGGLRRRTGSRCQVCRKNPCGC